MVCAYENNLWSPSVASVPAWHHPGTQIPSPWMAAKSTGLPRMPADTSLLPSLPKRQLRAPSPHHEG